MKDIVETWEVCMEEQIGKPTILPCEWEDMLCRTLCDPMDCREWWYIHQQPLTPPAEPTVPSPAAFLHCGVWENHFIYIYVADISWPQSQDR